jgi:hypothetical protein
MKTTDTITDEQLKATERELERWRHGVQIEGDYVCPDSLRMTEALAEVERLRAGIRQQAAQLVEWAVARGGHSPSAIVATNLRKLIGEDIQWPTAEKDIDGLPIEPGNG